MDRDLLASKLNPPRIHSDLISRSQLMIRLDEVIGNDFVLISTPAGFGKTTLLTRWVKSAGRPVAWLSLDEDDNDPVRFWRYILTALDQVETGMGEKAFSMLNSSAQPTSRAVVIALLNELATRSVDFVLVLDDYHLIESPAIHDSMVYLLEHLPRGIRRALLRARPRSPRPRHARVVGAGTRASGR